MLAENRDHPDQDQEDGIADESPITTTGHAKHELGHTIDDVADDSAVQRALMSQLRTT